MVGIIGAFLGRGIQNCLLVDIGAFLGAYRIVCWWILGPSLGHTELFAGGYQGFFGAYRIVCWWILGHTELGHTELFAGGYRGLLWGIQNCLLVDIGAYRIVCWWISGRSLGHTELFAGGYQGVLWGIQNCLLVDIIGAFIQDSTPMNIGYHWGIL